MDICRYFLCFALFSAIGWAYESAYYSLQQRRPVNSGFLNGCICPIYGIGGLLDLMLLGGIDDPIRLFFAGLLLTSSLEYFVSWLLEKLFHRRWWDYTNWPLNINGRVCIIAGAAFGIMTVFLIKLLWPATAGFISALPDTAVYILSALIAAGMLADICVTVHHSDSFSDKLWYVREQAKVFEDGFGGRLMGAVNSHIPDRNAIIERLRRLFRK